MASDTAPRSVRNNNPGNIERSPSMWLGLATLPEMNSRQREEQIFCVFRTAAYGFRALALDLCTKHDRGLDTIRKIISVFAPPNENDTEAYIKCVAEDVGIGPDDPVNFEDMKQLRAVCRAIAFHEAGSWAFTDDDLDTGVKWAWSSRNGALV